MKELRIKDSKIKDLGWKEYLGIGGAIGLAIGLPFMLVELAKNCPKDAIPDLLMAIAKRRKDLNTL